MGWLKKGKYTGRTQKTSTQQDIKTICLENRKYITK